MQNRQNGRRRRGNNPPRPMGQPMSGNRPDNRVRGNAHQLLEKYRAMARDSQQAGDRVAAEYYLQHADHYFRVLNDGRARSDEPRNARRGYEQGEDEEGDFEHEADARHDAPRGGGDMAEAADDARRPAARRAPVARSRGADLEDDEPQTSDGEAALIAFGGVEPELRPVDEPAPGPRRRGRPRKVQPTLADTP